MNPVLATEATIPANSVGLLVIVASLAITLGWVLTLYR